jgi:hypothetical protein
MNLDINAERQTVLQEINTIERIGSKIPHFIKNSKELLQIRTILRLIEKHLKEL